MPHSTIWYARLPLFRLCCCAVPGRCFAPAPNLGPREEPPVPDYQAKIIARLAALPQPVIAAIHGDCLTGGLELALAADIIVAGDRARFADTHARWAVMPLWGMTQRLPRRIGIGRAKMMGYTCCHVDAVTAERWGLADLHIAGDFDLQVDELVSGIAQQSPHSLRGYKRLFNETADLALADGLAWEIVNSPGKGSDFADRVAGRFGRATLGGTA
jgi:enoyl-CoA hydratase